uniref:Uncharacterized protein n=1 Tax=Cannabis sativa TaxID=3483 RepID=A0A803PIH0_CANSA
MQLLWELMPLMGVVSSCLAEKKEPLKPSSAQPAIATEISTGKKLKNGCWEEIHLRSSSSQGYARPRFITRVPYSHRPPHLAKKRFRTKFTQEQKDKMLNFAEKVGWKIQKQEESVVQQFCQEIGVKRRVLKVWMHNNKHNLAKKNPPPA